MKTLFFTLSLLIGCQATKVDVDEGSTGPDESTGAPESYIEPIGVMIADDCRHIDIGDKPCNFRLADQNGKTWDLYEHEGDVIVLDFSTVWCYPCQMAGHYTQPIQDEFESEGVHFVTILIDGPDHSVPPTPNDIDSWVTTHNITSAPVLEGSRDKMIDETGAGTEGYILGGFPTYIYIGRDMKFIGGHVGFSEEYVREKIEEAI